MLNLEASLWAATATLKRPLNKKDKVKQVKTNYQVAHGDWCPRLTILKRILPLNIVIWRQTKTSSLLQQHLLWDSRERSARATRTWMTCRDVVNYLN